MTTSTSAYGRWVSCCCCSWGGCLAGSSGWRPIWPRRRQELARQAAVEEKRRIARDVHDLVGHGLAAMLLHVTGARHVLRRDLDQADLALADAEAVGRRSMEELRRTLHVLRGPQAEPVAEPPLPDADDIADAVETARAAGVEAGLRVVGELRRIDPMVGLSLHRVVEEALANARRHAPRAVTAVVLTVEQDGVVLTVDSVGPIDDGQPDDDRPAALWDRRNAGTHGGHRRGSRGGPDRHRLVGAVPGAADDPGTRPMIRVVLVDDQTIVRTGLARILAPDDGFEVVAECADGEDAVATVPRLAPDVVLMDIRMPRLDGIEATRRLQALAMFRRCSS